MITNWDIISRMDPKGHGLRYSLVMDGTEHDARLIAKKLAGYVQKPQPAVAPFVYSFELPADLDEDTLDKIRTAVREGVEQSNKINQFVPGGILGDPLFNSESTQEDKPSSSFVTLDPSESFFRAEAPAAPSPERQPAQPAASDEVLSGVEQNTAEKDVNLEKQAPSSPLNPKEKSGEITISDKDMLIKDMEGTLLGKMPLEDIFSAETKYDMFLDLENQQLSKNSQLQREQKINTLADGKDSLEESFNVFEQKLKDQTCFVDLEDLNTITDRLSQKNTDFLQHAAQPAPAQPTEFSQQEAGASAPQPAAQFQTNTEDNEVEDPFEQIEKQSQRQEMAHTQPAQPEPEAAPVLQEQPPVSPENISAGKTAQPEIEKMSVTPGDDEPLNLGPSPEEASVSSFAMEKTAPGEIPEEVALLNTIAPHHKGKEEAGNSSADSGDLPEITIRGQKIDSLEKTFNLETTLNTEIMRHQYEKSFHDIPAAQQHQQPQQPAAVQKQPAAEKTQKLTKTFFRLKGKKLPDSVPVQSSANTAKPGEPIMDENQEPKTTFRIRRKVEPTPQAPVPPAAPQPPAGPSAPATPKLQPQTPAPTQPQPVSKPQPIQAKPASGNTILEKTKTIDHSIEMPLSELKKHNWPLEVPLVPTYTLETMVMSVNRFAHATAISVIENPGKLYNPLVLHGATGTGKTHFLNAMAYAFSKKFGQENIFMTNGVRLSRGIQRYVMEGNIEKFEKFMDTVKVLLIDDIHLLAINEQNRAHISKLLNTFLQDQKQIVITSKYPPESLEKLEELIKFRLDSGWISELKPASGAAHLRIVKKMLLDNGVDLNDTQINTFFGGPHMTLGTVTRSIRRLKVLENLIFPHLAESERSQATIFEKLLATSGEDANSEILSRDPESISSISMFGNGEWGRIGFFYPQNSSHMMNWMVYALQQRAKELGIEGSFEIAVRSSYATENIISSAFKIANLCDNKKLKGAVILGPALKVCDPSVRENFYDILTHMLEIMLIRCGIINFEDAKAPSSYVKVLSELLR